MHPSVRKVCIVKGTHRYEKGAQRLGDPLVDELRRRGIEAVLHTVPLYAADTTREDCGRKFTKTSYWQFKRGRRDWWRSISKKENAPLFSLHSYPYNQPHRITEYSGWREIGSVGDGQAKFGIYVFDRIDLRQALQNRLVGTLHHLIGLWKKGISVWEDTSRYHSYIIEVPAVPDTNDPQGLKVDMERTKAMGFVGDCVVKTVANEIERIISASQAPKQVKYTNL